MTLAIVLSLLILLVLGVPVAIAIAFSAFFVLVSFTSLPHQVIAQQVYIALDAFPLAAIPFFILAGNLMEAGGLSARLVNFARVLVGDVQGGLAATCVLTSMLFAAISGSSVATTFAVGSVLIPALVRSGYPVGFSAALMAASAELGVIIPPSIPMILYGTATGTSIPALFLAGFGPGLLIASALIVTVLVWSRRKGWGMQDGDGRQPFWIALTRALPALAMPLLILGGIYGGVTTPTEASVVAVVYALATGALIERAFDRAAMIETFRRSVVSSTTIMFIIAAAGLFGFVLRREGVPDSAADWLANTFQSEGLYLAATNLFLFVTGMFVETSASVVVLAPILGDAAVALNIDPVHFGSIMVVNLALGMITPPFGVNLFAAAQIAGIPLQRMFRPLLVFIAVIIVCLAVITYVPALSLGLPKLLSN
ncbi:TRAP transporter large permease subunit [Rhizobium laguerreae]|uniref:TRAP transporter large permease n=1 Tax=Rhizobium laguerreae TaxID=1076926 RepID=UPI001C9246C3|nr:TRAP transporter large permease subunit [Rhizobium laguerreae]MBY3217746.1 TRAP transporter large permease subunit [Rhizobium laguerreae]